MKPNKVLTIMSFSVACMLLVISCKKSNNSDARMEMVKKYLTQKDWIIDKYVRSTNGGPLDIVTPSGSILQTCMADDVLKISNNNSFYFTDGALICNSTTLPYGNGSWAYDVKTDSITLVSINFHPALTAIWKITKLDDNIMVGTYAEGSSTYEITLKHPIINPKS